MGFYGNKGGVTYQNTPECRFSSMMKMLQNIYFLKSPIHTIGRNFTIYTNFLILNRLIMNTVATKLT